MLPCHDKPLPPATFLDQIKSQSLVKLSIEAAGASATVTCSEDIAPQDPQQGQPLARKVPQKLGFLEQIKLRKID
jgi:hypothetical protein